MPSNEHIPGAGAEALAQVHELVNWLTSTSVELALGACLGLVAERWMHAARVRWTWAASALGTTVMAAPLLSGHVAMLGTAALCACVGGRRRERRDLLAGGDLAELAAQHRGPLSAIRLVARTLGQRAGAGRAPSLAGPGDRGRLVVGRDRSGAPVSIPFGGDRAGMHTLVVGATGSGKTVTATHIATQAIARGLGVVAVDPKGDERLRIALGEAAELAGRRMIMWSPDGGTVYNPYARGDAGEIADKALAGERFTEPHYQRQAQRYLGHEVRALRAAGLEVSLAALVEHLEPERLELLVRELGGEGAAATHDYLDSLTTRQRGDLAGVRDRLSIMAESDFAAWLDPSTPEVECFDLLGAAQQRAVVYFELQADSRPLLAQMLGTAIVIDLQTAVASLQRQPVGTLVVIDEFSAVAAEQVTRLFGRARSAGVSLLLGTQELSDLRTVGREGMLEQVLGNLSALVAHRQVVPDSAELVARLAGSHGVWRTSTSSDGRWTQTRVSAPSFRAELARRLPDGQAAVVDLSGAGHVRVAQMLSSASHGVPTRRAGLARRTGVGLPIARLARLIASVRGIA